MSKELSDINRQTLAYELVKERLAQQIESVKSLDIKASITLAIIGVIFTGYLQSVITHVDSRWIRLLTFLILILAGVFAVKTFVQTKSNNWNDWRNDPDPEQLLNIVTNPDFKSYNDVEITNYILKSMAASYEHNIRLYRKRYNSLYISLALVLAAAIIIGIQVILEV